MSGYVWYRKSDIDQVYKDSTQNYTASLVAKAGFFGLLLGIITIADMVTVLFDEQKEIISMALWGCVVVFAILVPAYKLQALKASDKVARALRLLRVSSVVYLAYSCFTVAMFVYVAAMSFETVVSAEGLVALLFLTVITTLSLLCFRACGAAQASLQNYVPYDLVVARADVM